MIPRGLPLFRYLRRQSTVALIYDVTCYCLDAFDAAESRLSGIDVSGVLGMM